MNRVYVFLECVHFLFIISFIYIKPSTFAEKATFTALHHKAAVAALDPLLVKETAFKRVPFSSVIVTCAATGKQIKSGVVLCACDKDS